MKSSESLARHDLKDLFTKLVDCNVTDSRARYAAELGVTPSAVSLWTSGRTVPRPELLVRLIQGAKRRGDRAGAEAIQTFEKFAGRNVAGLSRQFHGFDSLGEYLNNGILNEIEDLLKRLPCEAKIGILDRVTQLADEPDRSRRELQPESLEYLSQQGLKEDVVSVLLIRFFQELDEHSPMSAQHWKVLERIGDSCRGGRRNVEAVMFLAARDCADVRAELGAGVWDPAGKAPASVNLSGGKVAAGLRYRAVDTINGSGA